MKTYTEMYSNAAAATYEDGEYRYKGYTGGNALSFYVYDNYGVNAADNSAANNALCAIFSD